MVVRSPRQAASSRSAPRTTSCVDAAAGDGPRPVVVAASAVRLCRAAPVAVATTTAVAAAAVSDLVSGFSWCFSWLGGGGAWVSRDDRASGTRGAAARRARARVGRGGEGCELGEEPGSEPSGADGERDESEVEHRFGHEGPERDRDGSDRRRAPTERRGLRGCGSWRPRRRWCRSGIASDATVRATPSGPSRKASMRGRGQLGEDQVDDELDSDERDQRERR